MDISTLDTKTLEPKEEHTPIAEPGKVASAPTTDQELADFFEVDKSEVGRLSPKLNTLMMWAKQNTPPGEDIRWTLRRLETKLGTPPMGRSQIDHMAEYAFLWLEAHDANRKLEQYGKL